MVKPVKYRKNGEVDKRGQNKTQIARDNLKRYIEKGKEMSNQVDDIEETEQAPQPDVENEELMSKPVEGDVKEEVEMEIHDSDFDSSSSEEEVVIVKKTKEKKKKVRRIVYEESSESEGESENFKKFMDSYKNFGKTEVKRNVTPEPAKEPEAPKRLTANQIIANKLRGSLVNF